VSPVWWYAGDEAYRMAILDRLERQGDHCADLCCDDPDACRCDCRWCDCRYAQRMGS